MTTPIDIRNRRHGRKIDWDAVPDRVLGDGESGRETDTGKVKTGDGVTPWGELGYDSDSSGTSLAFPIATVEAISDTVTDWAPSEIAAGKVVLRIPSLGENPPLPWEANHEYVMPSFNGVPRYVLPVPPNGHYYSGSACQGTTGAVEPDWTDAPSAFNDGTMHWYRFHTLLTTDGAWTAVTPVAGGGSYVIADGSVWFAPDGTTAADEPDWTTAPNYEDTVLDGTATWTRSYDFNGTWQANHTYRLNDPDFDTGRLSILPTTPDGSFMQTPTAPDPGLSSSPGTSGADQPTWPTDGTSVFDIGILWHDEGDEGDAFGGSTTIDGIADPGVDGRHLVLVNLGPEPITFDGNLDQVSDLSPNYVQDLVWDATSAIWRSIAYQGEDSL